MRHKHDIPDTEGTTQAWTLQHDHPVTALVVDHTHSMVTGPAYVDTTRSLQPEDADA